LNGNSQKEDKGMFRFLTALASAAAITVSNSINACNTAKYESKKRKQSGKSVTNTSFRESDYS
jgi:hypothetical protein